MKRNITCVLLLFFLTAVLLAPPAAGAGTRQMKTRLQESFARLAYGSPSDSIGTFDGWTFWIGWDGSFSENYDPFSETYAWVVYFAPEGVFLALQWAKSNYSNVDMYAAYDYFYGVMHSPFGSTLPKSYIGSLNGVSLSIDAFDASLAPVGALSHVSLAVSSAQTMFRIGSAKMLQRAVQYGAGMTASFSLLPFSLPFGVSLDYESGVEAGFYPIIMWDIQGASDPLDAVLSELRTRSQRKSCYDAISSAESGEAFPDYFETEIASMLVPVLEALPAADDIAEFVASSGQSSKIDAMISSVQQWLRTGDTSKLPGGIDLPLDPASNYAALRPLKAAVDACFELGYEHGYRSTDRDDTIYADCIVTVNCTPGDNCTLTVTDDEIAELVPGSAPEDFEGVWVGFDLTTEEFLVNESEESVYWAWIEEGIATYTFVNNSDCPLFLGVQVWPDSVTSDKTLELCRRKVVFEETFEVPDVAYEDIETDDDYESSCTAAELLKDADKIARLRRFRDRVLSSTETGCLIIDAYYRMDAVARRLIEKHPEVRSPCAVLLEKSVQLLFLLI